MNIRDWWARGWVRTATFWVGVIVAYTLVGINDWSRDWVEYRAESTFAPQTSDISSLLELPPGHPDFVSTKDWSQAVRWAGNRISNLELTGEASDGETIVFSFVRTHRLLRLKDDVIIRVRLEGRRAVIDGRSEARLHIGDLGRNPGTLRRLYAELEDVVAESNLNPRIGF